MSGSYGTAATGFEWNFYNTMEEGHMTNNPSEGAKQKGWLLDVALHTQASTSSAS